MTSIWSSNPTPAILQDADTVSVNLGVRFKSAVAGTISAIRFYHELNDTYSVALWTNAGVQLGTASVVVTSPGWQQANFSTPIDIAANTVYIASYRAPAGHYAANSNYFTAGVDNGPLHALADGEGGDGNGIYAYDPSLAVPTATFNKSNYWVDVVFEAPAAALPPQSLQRFYANLMGH